ncbi:MAG: hypothetical protein H0Z19_11730 [Archaeoglobus sp.]|nr:hypothetical protein [Archaeoglobus sp.]MBO8181118.1 hypothetical protein [Archaeoglobus sp.]
MRLKLAQYFHVLPSELEKVPDNELEEWTVLISVLNEVEGERYARQ